MLLDANNSTQDQKCIKPSNVDIYFNNITDQATLTLDLYSGQIMLIIIESTTNLYHFPCPIQWQIIFTTFF